MDAFIIEGGRPLRGTVEVRGAKNAALPMMAAALLLEDGKLVLRRVPNLADIKQMALVLQELGIRIDRRGDEMTLQVVSDKNCRASYELVSKMRASVCVLGPLVGKRRRAEVSMPGGCSIGDRPIDLHLKGLTALGASVAVDRGYVLASARRLHRLLQQALGKPSHAQALKKIDCRHDSAESGLNPMLKLNRQQRVESQLNQRLPGFHTARRHAQQARDLRVQVT